MVILTRLLASNSIRSPSWPTKWHSELPEKWHPGPCPSRAWTFHQWVSDHFPSLHNYIWRVSQWNGFWGSQSLHWWWPTSTGVHHPQESPLWCWRDLWGDVLSKNLETWTKDGLEEWGSDRLQALRRVFVLPSSSRNEGWNDRGCKSWKTEKSVPGKSFQCVYRSYATSETYYHMFCLLRSVSKPYVNIILTLTFSNLSSSSMRSRTRLPFTLIFAIRSWTRFRMVSSALERSQSRHWSKQSMNILVHLLSWGSSAQPVLSTISEVPIILTTVIYKLSWPRIESVWTTSWKQFERLSRTKIPVFATASPVRTVLNVLETVNEVREKMQFGLVFFTYTSRSPSTVEARVSKSKRIRVLRVRRGARVPKKAVTSGSLECSSTSFGHREISWACIKFAVRRIVSAEVMREE